MRIYNDSLITGTQTLNTNWTSAPQYLGHIANFSIQGFWSGAIAGSFSLQASSDIGQPSNAVNNALNVTNWTDVSNSSVTVSGAGDILYDVDNTGYTWVRLKWTYTSGSGQLDSARMNGKGV